MTGLTPDERRKLEALQQPKVTMQVTNLADVTPMNQPFLWYPYLPLGRVVIVAGAPGHGKSQFSAMLAGNATRGNFPGNVSEASRVLMLCAEDDMAMTVVPRLLAAHANLRLVDTINVVTEHPSGLTAEGLIRIPTDSEVIHQWVKANVNARLIVLDPVASFFDRGHNMLFNQDTREALGPLVAIAKTYGVTIVIILHLNKSESKDFANRIAESHGFQALARSVMALAPDPDDPDRERGSKKILALTKANLVKPGNYSIRYELRSVTLGEFTPPIETSELAMVGRCEISADDLLISASERSERFETRVWLSEFIGDGWRRVEDVRQALKSDGLMSWKSVSGIARTLGYQRVKQRTPNGPWWIGHPDANVNELPGGDVLEIEESSRDVQVQFPLRTLHPEESEEGTEPEDREGPLREGPNSANSPNSPEGGEGIEEGNGWGAIDLDAYREWEDRRLGERDDDDS